jgi:GPH family glycoside/pentoside/hexuronide:cation symporter
MTPHQPDHPLPWTQKLSYGLPAFALAVVGIPVYVHIPKFYTDVIGVNITWVGTILMLARLFDAFSDPLMGVISDRVRTRMGRRRPFILWGSFCLAAAMFLLFVPRTLQATLHSSGLRQPSWPCSCSGPWLPFHTKLWDHR